jgi:DNA-binding response OmpR family regulator
MKKEPMHALERTSIILVEDDKALRESIAEYLTCVGFDVTAVGDGLDFFRNLGEKTFAAAIIDQGLPDLDGLRLVEYLHANSSIRCIILTARDAVESRIAGYDAGADLYMVKPVDCRELASALSNSIKRKNAEGTGERSAVWRLNRGNATLISPDLSMIPLTGKEFDFIRCLATAPEQVVARQEIMTSLQYQNDEFANRALESLVRRLRRKIERAAKESPIITRHGVGYSFAMPVTII